MVRPARSSSEQTACTTQICDSNLFQVEVWEHASPFGQGSNPAYGCRSPYRFCRFTAIASHVASVMQAIYGSNESLYQMLPILEPVLHL